MTNNNAGSPNPMRSTRVLIIGLVAVILALGFAFVASLIGRSTAPPKEQ